MIPLLIMMLVNPWCSHFWMTSDGFWSPSTGPLEIPWSIGMQSILPLRKILSILIWKPLTMTDLLNVP